MLRYGVYCWRHCGGGVKSSSGPSDILSMQEFEVFLPVEVTRMAEAENVIIAVMLEFKA
jgi:hypothetical protein